jgi:hypothetical protein
MLEMKTSKGKDSTLLLPVAAILYTLLPNCHFSFEKRSKSKRIVSSMIYVKNVHPIPMYTLSCEIRERTNLYAKGYK